MSATELTHVTDSNGRTYDVRGSLRYRIKSTNRGSSSLGPCEVCGKHADTVHLQVQQRRYEYDGDVGWSHHGCKDLFGHEACLLAARTHGE